MEVEVSVPGTLSNLGPGFDVLGMAIEIENAFRFRSLEAGRFEVAGKSVEPESHLSFRTMLRAADRFGAKLEHGVSLEPAENVPRARGLGSSATARVAGLFAWSEFTGEWPGLERVLSFLADEEGHPDNCVPAVLGGLTFATWVDGSIRFIRKDPKPNLAIALCVPDKIVRTEDARAVLPAQWPRSDVVFDLGRLAFLLHGLDTMDPDALAIGGRDRLHQPYRAPLIGPAEAAMNRGREAGGACAFISGSGSVIAAFVDTSRQDPSAVASAMASAFLDEGLAARALSTRPAARGAWRDPDAS